MYGIVEFICLVMGILAIPGYRASKLPPPGNNESPPSLASRSLGNLVMAVQRTLPPRLVLPQYNKAQQSW